MYLFDIKGGHKGLKICGGITVIFLIIVAIVVPTLRFTTLKPKDPEIIVYPQHLENWCGNLATQVYAIVNK